MPRQAKPAARSTQNKRSQPPDEAKGVDGAVESSKAPSLPVEERPSRRPRQIRAAPVPQSAGVPASISTPRLAVVDENVNDGADAPIPEPLLAEAAAFGSDGVERLAIDSTLAEGSVPDPSHHPGAEDALPDVANASDPVREGNSSLNEETLESSEDEDMGHRLQVC